MPEFQMVFDYIYDYDFGCILHHDISYLKTLFSSFVAEKMLMSHTILKKKLSFLTVAEKMLVANHWLVRRRGKGHKLPTPKGCALAQKISNFCQKETEIFLEQ